MQVFITGGTGLIGRALARRLVERGDSPIVLTRQADRARLDPGTAGVRFVQGDPGTGGDWPATLGGCDAVVNLVGHNVFAERWNDRVKRTIRDSRVTATANVVAAIAGATSRPRVLVQASAIGYYGDRGDEDLTESSPPGADFMAGLCREWEAAAEPAEALGLRLATLRIGVVLDCGGGALATMAPLYKWLPGGAAPLGSGGSPWKPGTGRQWMSWIHLDDIVGLLLLALDDPAARGPINGTAPNPVRHVEFGRALAKVLRRPFLPVGPPDALIRLALGEIAVVVTKGQKVLPARAQELGYAFQYPEVIEALRAAFAGPAAVAVEARPA